MSYDIGIGRDDLRWLDVSGNEVEGRKWYLFRSATTDEAQKLIEKNGFSGSYIRHLSTGHSETESINLAMLGLAEKNEGIVGVTLEGLVKDKIAKCFIGYPAGRILYEILEAPNVFRVSTEEGIVIPDFTIYGGIDTYVCRLGGGFKLIPEKKDKITNKQASKIKGKVFVELQPEFVANLGSVNMEYGPLNIDSYREMVEQIKQEPIKEPSLIQKIRDYIKQ